MATEYSYGLILGSVISMALPIAATAVLLAALAMAALESRRFRELESAQKELLQQQAQLLKDHEQLHTEKMGLLEENALLSDLSVRDSLTRLFNRRHFDVTYDTEFRRAQRDRKSLALLFIDVDFFKALNDSIGHQSGDECLRQIARTLEQQPKRAHDVTARYGGEEFVILLPGASLDGACRIAEAARQAVLSLQIEHRASPVDSVVTVCVGVAACQPKFGDRPEELLAAADAAMYRAKTMGRNRVEIAGQLTVKT